MQIQQYSAVNTIAIGTKCAHMRAVSSLVAQTLVITPFKAYLVPSCSQTQAR